MENKKCNCKKCKKLDYINRGLWCNLITNIVYCNKFPNGVKEPFCCKDYEKEVKNGRTKR